METPPLKRDYKDTLNLPKTDFPMRANLPEREPVRIEWWQQEKIHETVLAKNAGRPKFVLHDGPPYANGSIHFGHILNKVLKDIAVKYKNMAGFQAQFVPGWDCHGLPIEHQVDKDLKKQKKEFSVLEIRQACREYAAHFVSTQKKEFMRLGILGKWDHPYQTMNFSYEAATARELAKMVRKGLVYKGAKPVHWCTHCKTALAEAEVEYDNHLSPSIYVKFQSREDLGTVDPALAGTRPYFIIWTTTPWTLPANLALAIHEKYMYVALQVGDEIYIVAEGLLDQIRKKLNLQEDRLLARIPASRLEGIRTQHPFLPRESTIVLGDHVTLEVGTGIVHTAPGHGQEDYEVGRKYGLPILNPVDHQGKFTEEVGVPAYVGQYVLKANTTIIEDLRKQGSLLKSEELSHSFPHCWRCKNPVIFRSTPQYFVSLSAQDLRGKALDAIRRTQWIPHWGRDRIYGMVENRPDWCISRQRVWGVPIMGFQCTQCSHSLLKAEILEHIAERFETEGADAFFKYSSAELLPANTLCPQCGHHEFHKESDILDVWFDSGTSYAAVLENDPDLHFPADLYLEGSDQHRGWFHSSLLASMATRGTPPYRSVLTHGFVVDGSGKKYSKSAKNYTPPEKILNTIGAELLRLWVAAEDYRNDIRFSEEILERLKETYRKIRNTARFLLGNLDDFDPEQHRVPLAQRPDLDRWAIANLQELIQRSRSAYDHFDFHILYHALNHYCTVTLSAFYLDILKDRLYCSGATSPERRAAQSTLYEILETLVPILFPILSFTAEEIFQLFPGKNPRPPSVYLREFPQAQESLTDPELSARFERIMTIRQEVLKALEDARREKRIGHPLEAQVRLKAEGELQKFLQQHLNFWAECFIVSQVVIVYELKTPQLVSKTLPGLEIEVLSAEGEKCERCWTRSITVGKSQEHSGLCDRCVKVLQNYP